jgi:hypothetical protein
MNEDFLDLLSELCAVQAKFMIVGAYAVAVHGHPRATKDLDVWVEASTENAPKVIAALNAFGAPLGDFGIPDLVEPGTGFMMGLPPRRIDILTKLSDVDFASTWPKHIEVEFAPRLRCPVIGLEDLLKNKRAAGRLQDLADVAALERLRGRT